MHKNIQNMHIVLLLFVSHTKAFENHQFAENVAA